MNKILCDLSAPALTAAIEENLEAFAPYFLKWSESGQYTSSLKWSITDIPFPMFNNILGARLTVAEADREIEAAIVRGQARKVPLLWFTGPSTTPADLGKRLIAHGFVLESEAPGMAAVLDHLHEGLSKPANLKISQVTDLDLLKVWCDTMIPAFEMPEYVGPAFRDFFGSFPLQPEMPLRHYIGWLAGQPVAIGSMLLAAGVAGIYNVATLPGFRGQGIGSVMTSAPLLSARSEGYRVGILQATSQGFGVYRKLGFSQYCRIGSYIWSPPG